MIKIGYHVSKSGGLGIVNNIKELISQGGTAVQFFLSPKQGCQAGIPLTEREVSEIKVLQKEHNLYIVVHGKYILNFARPKDENTAWQQTALVKDMVEANRLGVNVIIHQGKHVKDLQDAGRTRDDSLNTFVLNVKEVLAKTAKLGCTNKIVLENSCQQGNELGYSLDELAKIYYKFSSAAPASASPAPAEQAQQAQQAVAPAEQAKQEQDRISFCIDLCHIFVSGELDVRDEFAVIEWFARFDKMIGLSKLEVIHFNDSKAGFNCKCDHHDDLLIGYIGNQLLNREASATTVAAVAAAVATSVATATAGFKMVANIAKDNNIAMILETPGITEYVDQIALVKSWVLPDGKKENGFESHYLEKYAWNQTDVVKDSKKVSKKISDKVKISDVNSVKVSDIVNNTKVVKKLVPCLMKKTVVTTATEANASKEPSASSAEKQ